jgi:NAD(P)-dependent dehydrogenase (short-subunit alcohol dehydrogenase family)
VEKRILAEGKVAIVTRGNSRIGIEFSLDLAAATASIVDRL